MALREAHQFLDALFGSKPEGAKIALWTKQGKTSHYLDTVRDAARVAAAAEADIYVHAGLAGKSYGPGKRLRNNTAAGIPGVWADIDVDGGPDNKRGAAPSLDAALELARSVLEPTIVVCSGYGLHAWWLLDDGPWVFGTPAERERALEVSRQWNNLLKARARDLGFNMDALADLARLMRIPGTMNHKGAQAGHGPVPVCGHPVPVGEQDGPRHEWGAIAELAAQAPAVPVPSAAALNGGPDLQLRLDAGPPVDKHEVLMANSDLYARTWQKKRAEAACKGWTASEYDLSLASQWVAAEWTDQEIADGLAAFRRLRFPEGAEKAVRADYVRRTIARARLQATRDEKAVEKREALEDLAHVAETGSGDPEATVSAFNKIVGGPEIRELVQDGQDPSTVTYTLVMASGDPVRLGPAGHLMSQDRFAEAFMVVTGHVLHKVKQNEWRDAVQALLIHRQVRESPDDTPEGVVLEWLRRYLHERVTSDPDEAARSREPFEKDGRVYVFGASFGTFVRSALRVRVDDPQVKDMLRHAGFERTQHGYKRRDESWTTASYYAAPGTVLE